MMSWYFDPSEFLGDCALASLGKGQRVSIFFIAGIGGGVGGGAGGGGDGF